ncbi:DnaT-like ssDNA-binding protein [Acidovorax sp. MR-S7]|uniref:DnaT-like ssDNA-binding protein n=1 Tax=Acidovorax sp. MR-S7 TaxID=1268622 RepID=UPI000381DB1C|nr:DnaT-like ssDNA-binding protein [Acidovorax sp. MR-S7]GAD20956.1 hypothetical protein AVS7_00717 [Acidovorax sp. MR-S7]
MLIVAPADGFDSLVSVAHADAYMLKMGHSWSGAPEERETYLRRATQYLLSAYSIRPEYLNPVHTQIESACCEAALRASTGHLFEDVEPVSISSETVGPISTTYSAPRNGGQVKFGVIDALLRGLIDGRGMVKLIRA